jgi:hypothetical protein
VLCPSASTGALDGASVSVIPLSVIVDAVESPPYVAVTVAEVSLLDVPAV